MSAKSISEADGKAIISCLNSESFLTAIPADGGTDHLTRAPVLKPTPLKPTSTHNPPPKLASLFFPEDASVESVLQQAESTYPWLLAKDARFVAKPDQLIKVRTFCTAEEEEDAN